MAPGLTDYMERHLILAGGNNTMAAFWKSTGDKINSFRSLKGTYSINSSVEGYFAHQVCYGWLATVFRILLVLLESYKFKKLRTWLRYQGLEFSVMKSIDKL